VAERGNDVIDFVVTAAARDKATIVLKWRPHIN